LPPVGVVGGKQAPLVGESWIPLRFIPATRFQPASHVGSATEMVDATKRADGGADLYRFLHFSRCIARFRSDNGVLIRL
ncbi:hypothetical protein, partial [Endothiovibrio diazotrophicus]